MNQPRFGWKCWFLGASLFFSFQSAWGRECFLHFAPILKSSGQTSELRIGTYNILELGRKTKDSYNQNFRALKESARVILENDLDIIVIQEIGSVPAFHFFAENFFEGNYRPFVLNSHGRQGADIGFLVKSKLPFDFEIRSHKDRQWKDPTRPSWAAPVDVFSQDLPSLIVWENQNRAENKPLLVLLGTHFRSKRSRGGDRQGTEMRTAQVRETVEVIREYHREFGEDTPIVLAGDFNNELHRAEEFRPLWEELGMTESMDLAGVPRNPKDRATHTLHHRGRPHFQQLDGILVTRALRKLGALIHSFVYRYRRRDGSEKPLPRNPYEKNQNPSDHFPVIAIFDLGRLLQPATNPSP